MCDKCRVLNEEEYAKELQLLEESKDDNLQSFLKWETVSLMEKLADYEDKKAEELFNKLKEIQKNILNSLEESTELVHVINMANSADSPKERFEIYNSNRYQYILQSLDQQLEEMKQVAREELRDYISESYSRAYLGGGHILSKVYPEEYLNTDNLDLGEIDALLESEYHGKTLQERIEEKRDRFRKRVKNSLVKEANKKRDVEDTISEAEEETNRDLAALLLIARTRIMNSANEGLMFLYKDNQEVVQGLEYVATLDLKTCSVCGGFDGNVYYWGEPRPYLPQHPRCRCVYAPKLITVSEFNNKFGTNIEDVPMADKLRPSWKDWMKRKIENGNLQDNTLKTRIFGNLENYNEFVNKIA